MALDLEEVRSRLPNRYIRWFASVDSTMHEAARLAAEGCASGTVVIADEQTAGQGRLGRSWYSVAGTGLYLSVVLRYPFPPDSLGVVTMALGIGVREAIAQTTGLALDLRWPNDILIGDRKCAGILTQFENGAIIAGVGVNVNQSNFPPDIAGVATSLRIAAGAKQSREDLLVSILPGIDAACELLLDEGRHAVLRLFAGFSSYVSGRRVVVDLGESELRGTTAGLSATGFLLVRDDAGVEHTIVAGGVRPA